MDMQPYYPVHATPNSPHGVVYTQATSAVRVVPSPTRREVAIRPKPERIDPITSIEHLQLGAEGDKDGSLGCDFVRKLYHLLEDDSWSDIMCWGPQGDFFAIKDVGTFSNDILPRVFRHSNFASFVRQLNKYDFHKIKSNEYLDFDRNCWLFRHDDFYEGGFEDLENIRRKIPGVRRNSRSAERDNLSVQSGMQTLQAQIAHMAQQQDELCAHIQNMQNGYVAVLDGMVSLQRDFVQQDDTMRQLMQYVMQMGNDGALQYGY